MRLTGFHISLAAIGLALAPPALAQMGGGMMPSGGAPKADATVPYNKGVAAFDAGDYSTAIRELRKARAADVADGAIAYALGMAYAASGKKEDAKRAFQGAVRTANAPAGAYLQLGLVALELGERETAAKQYAALEKKLAGCGAKCGDEARGEIQSAMDQLSQRLGTP